MQKAIISIVYHSPQGNTKQVAELLGENLASDFTKEYVLSVSEATHNMTLLHQSDTIIFGSPMSFGNVTAPFKAFMELTEKFWYKQLTLTSLALFAAQHSMIWTSQGILPRFMNDEQTEEQNRIASYLGLTVQCGNGAKVLPQHPGDQLTLELFAQRIVDITLKYKNLKIYNYDTRRN